MEIEKHCTGCDTTKPAEEFHRNRAMGDGRHRRCKDCRRGDGRRENARNYPKRREGQIARARAWAKDHPERAAGNRRDSHLRRRYGITADEYDAMLAAQNGRCAICGCEPKPRGRRLRFDVDHDHETGEMRGLLCLHCNTALGNFRDNPDLLRKAIAYLEAPPWK